MGSGNLDWTSNESFANGAHRWKNNEFCQLEWSIVVVALILSTKLPKSQIKKEKKIFKQILW
jgi:hypothetical protein